MVDTRKNQILSSAGKIKAQYAIKNANIINVFTKEIIYGDIALQDGVIVGIGEYDGEEEWDAKGKYICPGLIDAHVHIESTMVTPVEFAKMVLPCGTTTVIADPHEIANVSGLTGIDFMIEQSKDVSMNIYFMLPSCVPATSFENNGAMLDASKLRGLIEHPQVLGLGELMDYPAVIGADQEVLRKIELAKYKIVDGHSPHLKGKDLQAYKVAGVHTEHECSTAEEAIERIRVGMYVQIREGSAARNAEEILNGLIKNNIPLDRCVFCTDDRHLDDIATKGHIDYIVRLAIRLGLSPIQAITLATIQAANCYGLKTKGAIAPGYDADLLVIEDLENFVVDRVMVGGQWVVEENKLNEQVFKTKSSLDTVKNSVHMPTVDANDFRIQLSNNDVHVIQMIPEQIETNKVIRKVTVENGYFAYNANDQLCKIAVIERHKNSGNIGIGLIEGFEFKNGAIAQSIAHDSHNIIVVGDNDEDMAIAANHIAKMQGGITIVSSGMIIETLPLPIAGLMSDKDPNYVMSAIQKLNQIAREMGVPKGVDPFLTLGFMALPVIPALRITDQGLFDVESFSFIGIEA